jgi:hypothetical protein
VEFSACKVETPQAKGYATKADPIAVLAQLVSLLERGAPM